MISAPALPVLITFPGHADPSLGLAATPRMRASLEALAASGLPLQRVDSVAAERSHLLAVHAPGYLERLEQLRGPFQGAHPQRTILPGGMPAILMAAGAVVHGVNLAVRSTGPARIFCLVEPPGHHAEVGLGGGFCVINNIAVGARHAQSLGLSRIMILDWDVHHGNGTQAIFERDPSVLFCDVHQHPLYPGTGHVEEMGLGEGLGTTVNVPLGAGSVDGDYAAVFREIYVPAAKAFRPDLLLVSCGFDAHHQDPLGGIKLTPGAFHHMAHACAVLADRWCGGRLVMALEGGYNHRAVAECVLATLRGLSGGDLPDEACAASPSTTAVLDHLLAHHPLLQGA